MTFKSLLPNRAEFINACYIAFALTLAFFYLEWTIEHQEAVMSLAEQCMEYSGVDQNNSEARMELYYSCLKGE